MAQTAAAETPFYIPAVGSPARPRRTLKHDDTFAVFDSHGDIGASTGGADGVFDHDTRHLSHLELLINGVQPLLLHSEIRDNNLSYTVDLTNPDHFLDGRLILAKDTVHIARAIYLYEGSLRERVCVTNHGSDTVTVILSITFASDFADIFEVRGMRRDRRGESWSEVVAETAVLRYRGLDGVLRETALAFAPTPTVLQHGAASYVLTLAPRESRVVLFTAACRLRPADPAPTFIRHLLRLNREQRLAVKDVATVETNNSLLNEILNRSLADLHMLVTSTPQGAYPYAGIPWYSTVFGRDGIITALQMLWMAPGIAAGVLRHLCRLQASESDARTDEEPGKILHEMRGGEMAALNEVPFKRYYGTVDATPLFVMLAGAYVERTGDQDMVRQLWPAIERAVAWMDGAGDVDGDGFIEYARGSESGLANQGWKDSHDAVFHQDGTFATGPIALVEAQGYVYAAKQAAATCATRIGQLHRARELQRQAERLREEFERAFWCEDIGSYALALDGDKVPCRVRTSNAGHTLFTGIANRERAGEIASGLMASPYYSGWGIRTVAEGEARYNPMSYHNGSIWPHDNALIAAGLAKYGYSHRIEPIFDGLMRAAAYMDQRRIPELYCGFRRRPGQGPTLYPAACSPQAWAAGAPFLLLASLLGVKFDPACRTVRFRNPIIPAMADEIHLHNLTLRGASADVRLHRKGCGVAIDVLRSRGEIRVTIET